MDTQSKKYDNKKKEEEKDDYYSKNRGEKYAPVKPGISSTTQPRPTYKSNADYYHSAID